MSFITGSNKTILIETKGGTEVCCYDTLVELINENLYRIGVNLGKGTVKQGIAKLETLKSEIDNTIVALKKDFSIK